LDKKNRKQINECVRIVNFAHVGQSFFRVGISLIIKEKNKKFLFDISIKKEEERSHYLVFW
jgi:hypothetical protein